MAFGGTVFAPLAGVFADIGWRVPFLIYAVALILLPVMAVSLPEPAHQERTGDRLTSIDDLRRTLADFPLRALAFIFAVGFVGQLLFYILPVQIPFYLVSRTGASASLVGVALAMLTFTGGVVATFYGRIRSVLSVVGIVALTFAFLSIGYALIGVVRTAFGIVVGLAIAGVGVGLIIPNLNAWLAAVVPKTARGRAVSGLTASFFLGRFWCRS